MKIRSILINALAVVIMSGALVFAVSEFVKSRQQRTMDQQHIYQLHSQSEQIHNQTINNSILLERSRALERDHISIDKVIRERMGLMLKNETYIPLSEL